ncbi:LOW QUALITY PROTEIN: hypothetical protein ACHAW6_013485 [Cyclotella cf. meneghiniana]
METLRTTFSSFLRINTDRNRLDKSGISLNIEDQGHPADYIGFNIRRTCGSSYKFTQRDFIDGIIDDINHSNSYTKPAKELQLPLSHGQVELSWSNYQAEYIICGIQVAKFSANPRIEHGKAIVCIGNYVRATCHIALCFKPDASKGFQCYCNTNFGGNWNKEFAATDPSTAKSRSKWSAACPIIWASKLQPQVALSMTQNKFIAMSIALCDIIPLMELIREMMEHKVDITNMQLYVICKVFEDNLGTLELARLPRLCSCTNHINICYHHFCEHVRKGLIKNFSLKQKMRLQIF